MKSGCTSAPRLPQTWQTNRASISDSLASSGHASPFCRAARLNRHCQQDQATQNQSKRLSHDIPPCQSVTRRSSSKPTIAHHLDRHLVPVEITGLCVLQNRCSTAELRRLTHCHVLLYSMTARCFDRTARVEWLGGTPRCFSEPLWLPGGYRASAGFSSSQAEHRYRARYNRQLRIRGGIETPEIGVGRGAQRLRRS